MKYGITSLGHQQSHLTLNWFLTDQCNSRIFKFQRAVVRLSSRGMSSQETTPSLEIRALGMVAVDRLLLVSIPVVHRGWASVHSLPEVNNEVGVSPLVLIFTRNVFLTEMHPFFPRVNMFCKSGSAPGVLSCWGALGPKEQLVQSNIPWNRDLGHCTLNNRHFTQTNLLLMVCAACYQV